MNEENKWKTTRRCSRCLANGETNYLWAQPWGHNQEGKPQFKLDCHTCGFHDAPTTWNGKTLNGGWGGHGDSHGQDTEK